MKPQKEVNAARKQGRSISSRWHRRFPLALEQQFALDFIQSRVSLLRVGCLLMLLLYVGVMLSIPGQISEAPTHSLAFLLSNMTSIVVIAMTFRPALVRLLPRLVTLALGFNGLVVVWCILSPESKLPFEIFLVNVLYTFLLGGLLFEVAGTLVIGLVAIYMVAAVAMHLPSVTLFNHVATLLIFGSIGALACYLNEGAERRAWRSALDLKEMAFMDDLTRLSNRRHFFSESSTFLKLAKRDAVPMSALMIDIDHFKAFNDTYGHFSGDDCLREVAQVVKTLVRRPLDLGARLGGEEFAVMLYGCDMDEAKHRAMDFMKRLEILNIENRTTPLARVTVSIGVAYRPPGAVLELSEFLAEADRALYVAKTQGRNCIR